MDGMPECRFRGMSHASAVPDSAHRHTFPCCPFQAEAVERLVELAADWEEEEEEQAPERLCFLFQHSLAKIHLEAAQLHACMGLHVLLAQVLLLLPPPPLLLLPWRTSPLVPIFLLLAPDPWLQQVHRSLAEAAWRGGAQRQGPRSCTGAGEVCLQYATALVASP